MTRLTKIADWDDGVRVNVVFVHGLGGHPNDTWRRNGDDNTFWPAWLARDISGLAAWTLVYDAPPSNWFGTAMALQDRAKNVLECLLGQPELRGRPFVFIGHSLGGLVAKQVLCAADGRRAYSAADAAFVDSVKGVVFIATPHTGSLHATLLDRLRVGDCRRKAACGDQSDRDGQRQRLRRPAPASRGAALYERNRLVRGR